MNTTFHAWRVRHQKNQGVLFETALSTCDGTPFGSRSKVTGGNVVRLDAYDPKSDYVLLDFTQLREDGPGVGNKSTPLKDAKSSKNEQFGHETAALYVPSKQALICQHVQRGVRASSICAYVS